jgi:hypothetical protein
MLYFIIGITTSRDTSGGEETIEKRLAFIRERQGGPGRA